MREIFIARQSDSLRASLAWILWSLNTKLIEWLAMSMLKTIQKQNLKSAIKSGKNKFVKVAPRSSKSHIIRGMSSLRMINIFVCFYHEQKPRGHI